METDESVHFNVHFMFMIVGILLIVVFISRIICSFYISWLLLKKMKKSILKYLLLICLMIPIMGLLFLVWRYGARLTIELFTNNVEELTPISLCPNPVYEQRIYLGYIVSFSIYSFMLLFFPVRYFLKHRKKK